MADLSELGEKYGVEMFYPPGESPEEKWASATKEARLYWRMERRAMLQAGTTAAAIAARKSYWLSLKLRFFTLYCPPMLVKLRAR